jgi:hypothetical protein
VGFDIGSKTNIWDLNGKTWGAFLHRPLTLHQTFNNKRYATNHLTTARSQSGHPYNSAGADIPQRLESSPLGPPHRI